MSWKICTTNLWKILWKLHETIKQEVKVDQFAWAVESHLQTSALGMTLNNLMIGLQ